MRDLICRNLARTIDGNESRALRIRRYFSCRPVTIRRRKNGEWLALHVELKNGCLFVPALFTFVHSSRTLSGQMCNQQRKSFIKKK